MLMFKKRKEFTTLVSDRNACAHLSMRLSVCVEKRVWKMDGIECGMGG